MNQQLDPQVAELLEAIEAAGIPPMHSMSYAEARKFYEQSTEKVAGDLPAGELLVNEQTLATSYPLRARIYRKLDKTEDKQACLIYFHGGGWCIGSLDSHDHVCRWLAINSGVTVISVDYRLAPEHKFPTAVEDAYAACKWITENAEELNIDAERIAIGGDSAGGNLSAVVCLLARDLSSMCFCCQVLIYPATDMLMRYPSHAQNGDGYRLTRSLINWFVNGYLRDGEDMNDMRASPLLASSHAGLPPAYISTAGFDPLKDEGRAYADKLSESGVDVHYQCYEGMMHGFIAMPGAIDMAGTALSDAAAYLKKYLSA